MTEVNSYTQMSQMSCYNNMSSSHPTNQVCIFVFVCFLDPLSDEHRLMQELTTDYNTNVRPRSNSSTAVDIQVRFSLQQIYDLVG